jgi:capsular polysaccharide biosynthesis protein
MSMPTRPDAFELADYLGVLRRRWWIVAGIAAICLIGTAAYVKVAPKSYTATAAIYVSATATNNNQALGRTSGPVTMDNAAQIAQSRTVAALAARSLHSPLPPQRLVKQISVTVPPNTTVLDINCKAPTPRAAAACANDFAAAYLSNRLASSTSILSTALTALQAKEGGLVRQVSRLKHSVASSSPSSSAHTTAQIQLTAVNGQLSELEAQINDLVPELASLQAPHNISAGHIITPAVPPASPSSPRKLLLLPSGLLAGLLIGLLAGFVAERRDDRIRSARDVQRQLDIPVLLSIPAREPAMRVALAAARSRTGQAFTDLAQDVAASLGEGSQLLIVAGPAPGPGGGVISANLAAALARTRSEVLLVCADLRDTAAATALGVGGGRGLAELLAGRATVGEVARRAPDVPRLRVITPGIDTAAVLYNLQHDALRRLAAELRSEAGFVVIDARAAGDGSSAFALAEFADAAVLAIEAAGTTRRSATDCLRRLDRLRTAVLGAAVIPVPRDQGTLPPRPAPEPGRGELPADAARPGAAADGSRVRDAPEPAAAAAPGSQRRDGTAAARRLGATWPLPRVTAPIARSAPGARGESGDPTDKAAGG